MPSLTCTFNNSAGSGEQLDANDKKQINMKTDSSNNDLSNEVNIRVEY